MSDIISKIKLPDNVTYDIKDTVSGYTTNTGTVTGVKVNGTTKNPTSGIVDIGTVATTDTKNTAGSTDTSSKIFLVGATSQAANPQTYSQDTAYVGTDGCLYSGSKKVVVTDDSRLSDARPASDTTSTYSSTGTAPVNGTAVAAALATLDGSVTGSAGAGKTLTAFSETDGKVSATFGDINITKSQVSDLGTIGTAAAKAYTTSVTSGSGDLVTSGAVWTAIDNLPEPMIFKGTLGTGGTITSLPTAAAANEGFTYKVITAGTYASTAAKVGDVFVSNGSSWVLIPAGDTDSDTWRNIKINGTEKLGSGISTGAVDFVNGTNTTVSFNATGNKVSINATDTNTHRPIQVNGTQILGDNTTALNLKAGDNVSVTNSSGTVTIAATDTTYSDATTSASGLMSSDDKTKLNGVATGAEVNQNAFSNVKVGTTTVAADAKTDTVEFVGDGIVTITGDATNDKVTISATAPVTSVAGQTGDVTLTNSDVGLGNVGNFKAVSTVASQGLTTTEKSNARTNIGAGTSSLTLGTTSSKAFRGDYGNTAYTHATDSSRLTTATASGLYKVASTAEGHIASLTAVAKSDITGLGIPGQDTTYESKAAVSGGTDVSLCTTGEKYTWNNAETKVEQIIPTGTAATVSHPILMSSDNYSDDTSSYIGDVYRNNAVYCNPSSGTVHCGQLAVSPSTTSDAGYMYAENDRGRVGVLVQSTDSTNKTEVMGLITREGTSGDPHFIIHRPTRGSGTSYATRGTYVCGYNYNNEWEEFLVQGRSEHYWGVIPAIQSSNGVMEIGKHIDFHTASSGTNDYNYRISCTGEGAATYSGTWTKSSSEKIKENIEDLDLEEAEKILELRPVSFDYREGYGSDDQVGLIAEEVAEVIPRLTVPESGEEGTDDWSPASVDYIGIVPYLLKVVQEQQKEIEELKAKVG